MEYIVSFRVQGEVTTMSTTSLILLIAVLVLMFGSAGSYYWTRKR
jgi:hypothetical protein